MSPQDPLAHLKDIHLPDAVGFWPPAWGWWLLSLAIIAVVGSVVYILRRKKFRNAYRKSALTELRNIQMQFTTEKNAEYLQAVSILLRRTALSGCGDQFNASLKGEDWLQWLDAQQAKSSMGFSNGVGRALLIGPYQKNPEFERHELHKLVESWIQQHRNQWQKRTNSNKKSKKPATTEKESQQNA